MRLGGRGRCAAWRPGDADVTELRPAVVTLAFARFAEARVWPFVINITCDATQDACQALMNTDADQLQVAPAVKYSGAG